MSTLLSSISSNMPVVNLAVPQPIPATPPHPVSIPSANNSELEAAENERRRRRLLGYI